jgi:hypothetical protein
VEHTLSSLEHARLNPALTASLSGVLVKMQFVLFLSRLGLTKLALMGVGGDHRVYWDVESAMAMRD